MDRRISSKYGSSRKLRTHFVRISSNSILFFSLLRNLSFSMVFDHVPLTNFNEALTHPPRGVRCFTLLSPRRRRYPVKQREVRLAARFSNPTHCFNDPFYAPYGESLFKPSVWILTVVVKKILNLQTFVETIDVVSLGIKKHDV